jgi:hypothetical protein
MIGSRTKETACGAVSLRRHCPDQVPGGRRSASEPVRSRPLSLSSRLRVPPALRSVQLPRSPRRHAHGAWRRWRAPRVESPACTGQTSCLSEARGLAGRRHSMPPRSRPQNHSLAVSVGLSRIAQIPYCAPAAARTRASGRWRPGDERRRGYTAGEQGPLAVGPGPPLVEPVQQPGDRLGVAVVAERGVDMIKEAGAERRRISVCHPAGG